MIQFLRFFETKCIIYYQGTVTGQNTNELEILFSLWCKIFYKGGVKFWFYYYYYYSYVKGKSHPKRTKLTSNCLKTLNLFKVLPKTTNILAAFHCNCLFWSIFLNYCLSSSLTTLKMTKKYFYDFSQSINSIQESQLTRLKH